MCWGSCAGTVKAILLAAVLRFMSLSCCVCLYVGQWARCQHHAQFLGMSKSPALIPGLVALIPVPTSTSWHGERGLAAFPCHVCVEKAASLQLRDRRDMGRCCGQEASCNRAASRVGPAY